jgi:hypothetical protein
MIPTAEEFLKRENLPTDILSGDDINYAMIEFAKLHVEAALEEAGERAYFRDSNEFIFTPKENKQAILNSYPLENIK